MSGLIFREAVLGQVALQIHICGKIPLADLRKYQILPEKFIDLLMDSTRLKMELPILELLDDPDIEFWLSFEGAPDTWAEDIEIYAPGYIKMEEDGNGMASDYDHSNFKETFNL